MGNPFQYSCLENPMDRGAWWATVYRIAKSWIWHALFNYELLGNYHFIFLSMARWLIVRRLFFFTFPHTYLKSKRICEAINWSNCEPENIQNGGLLIWEGRDIKQTGVDTNLPTSKMEEHVEPCLRILLFYMSQKAADGNATSKTSNHYAIGTPS